VLDRVPGTAGYSFGSCGFGCGSAGLAGRPPTITRVGAPGGDWTLVIPSASNFFLSSSDFSVTRVPLDAVAAGAPPQDVLVTIRRSVELVCPAWPMHPGSVRRGPNRSVFKLATRANLSGLPASGA